MVLNRCDHKGCVNAAESTIGSCEICAKHWCFAHVGSQFHECPRIVGWSFRVSDSTAEAKQMQDGDSKAYYAALSVAKANYVKAFVTKVDVEALRSAASNSRGGTPCRIPAFDDHPDLDSRVRLISEKMGGQNCHADVVFNDGVTWIARLRLEAPHLPPSSVQDYIFMSEVATLEFLARNTRVPSPRVHRYEPRSIANAVGASYILMDKIPGKALDWGTATAQQRTKVMQQLADIFMELEKHPFDLSGSILAEAIPGTSVPKFRIGAFSQQQLFESPERSLGPFASLEESYKTIIERQQEAIASREIACLPVDNYLAMEWHRSHVSQIASSSVSRTGPFYLKHFDDKGDHIMVDEDYTITGIIDWEWASSEAKELAFSSPCMMWPVGPFYDGDNQLSEDEIEFAKIFKDRGRDDLSEIVRFGRRWQRFLFFLGGGHPQEVEEFEGLFQGLRRSFADHQVPERISSYQDWKDQALRSHRRFQSVLDETQSSTLSK